MVRKSGSGPHSKRFGKSRFGPHSKRFGKFRSEQIWIQNLKSKIHVGVNVFEKLGIRIRTIL